MADGSSDTQRTGAQNGPLIRPSETLHDLPVEYRWEVTRRHPYYLQFWKPARDYRHGVSKEPHELAFGKMAVLILQGIGFTGDPLPPASGAEALEMNQLAKGWLNGAVAPITVRGLIGMLMRSLPQESRRYVGELLTRSAQPSKDEKIRAYELISELMSTENSVLDKTFTAPVLSINVNAPQRAILESVEQMVREWKQQLEIPEHRRRDEMLPDYMSAWDQREGWTNGDYDIEQELSFRQIAERLSIPVRTVANHYYSAFELVCGHTYSFENWVRLFIVVKLNTLLGPQAMKRRSAANTARQAVAIKQVPESFMVGNPNIGCGGVIAGAADLSLEGADVDLMMDLCELVKNQFNDAAILRKLELQDTPEFHELTCYLRRRQDPTAE